MPLIASKKRKVRVKSYRLQKEARGTELDLDEIQSKYVKLESEYNSRINFLENEIKELHTILKEKEYTTEQLSERLDELDKKVLRTQTAVP